MPCDTKVAILRVTSLLLINKMTLKVIEANERVSRLSSTESDNYQLIFVPACQVTPWLNGYRTPNSHVSDPSSNQSRWDNWCFLLFVVVCFFVSSGCCSTNIRQWETLKREALGGTLSLSLSLFLHLVELCKKESVLYNRTMWGYSCGRAGQSGNIASIVYNFSDEIIK